MSTVHLPDLRQAAGDGCKGCDIILRGALHFRGFWLGGNVLEYNKSHESSHSPWPESEISVFFGPVDEDSHIRVVRLQRPRRDGNGPDELELEFYVPAGVPTSSPGIRSVGDIPATPDDPRCFLTIKSWIQDCLQKHSTCRQSRVNKEMPMRLLDVSVDVPCLVPTQNVQNYVALSHSWGAKRDRIQAVPKTTKTNITQQYQGIPWIEFTKTFRDAITITRRLGLKYIWIDALCIIQDDAADWAAEASRMSSIYENAYVVVAATRSRTGDDGCFYERCPSYAILDDDGEAMNVSVKQLIEHSDFAAKYPVTFETMPLFDRAWVFQERLLASRIVHYTQHELVWECKEALRCECHGIESGKGWDSGKYEGNFKLDHARVIQKTDNIQERYTQWMMVVNQYTARSLAFDSDRLPALSGVARRMHMSAMGRYHAGIYENTLPGALLWMTSIGMVEKGWRKRRPAQYRAPSWSWASVEAQCGGWLLERTGASLAQVKDIECSLATLDPYGQVSDGFLILRAPCVDSKLVYDRSPRILDNGDQLFRLRVNETSVRLEEDVPLDDAAASADYMPEGAFVLVAFIEKRPLKDERPWYRGVALRPSRRVPGAWERIGRCNYYAAENLRLSNLRDLRIV
ncbi:uncharacterized protein HMPREF1541_04149 [Cyphellophora europaea CBS 101466]|uniref:Heterokaryon incompatibility domain-containing protein n=1 Tax=Cyphellophora europaea (strain CBS 101466) TaxID=1220924 RepID=W2S2C7_CYPE1|nr:uncharacterized protein HMPREF1541_04149 [Cyphellophora europaea CBS 101466]ETN42208.1 hypothetical protein HMPREF1541_04149 [Cyphellophora europaea CBS 101466]